VLTVVGVTSADVDNVLASPMTDFEDALLACCAMRLKALYIVTRDGNGFHQSPIQAFLDVAP